MQPPPFSPIPSNKNPAVSKETTGFCGACGRTRTGDLRITNVKISTFLLLNARFIVYLCNLFNLYWQLMKMLVFIFSCVNTK